MTKREAYERLGLAGTCDYALPQQWVDSVAERIKTTNHDEILCNFVWQYDPQSAYGRPLALTMVGDRLLIAINREFRTSYPLTNKELGAY